MSILSRLNPWKKKGPGTPSQTVVDNNALVEKGMVFGPEKLRIVRKQQDRMFMRVEFYVGKKRCTGTLHVSQLPSKEEPVRNQMFEDAQTGPCPWGLEVIDVIPPVGERSFTLVRFTARDDFDEGRYLASAIHSRRKPEESTQGRNA